MNDPVSGTDRAGGPPGDLPDLAYLVALTGLSGMGPARLGRLLALMEPAAAWRWLRRGDLARPGALPQAGLDAALVDRWRRESGSVDVGSGWAAHREAGVEVIAGASLPTPLGDDPEPPAVLFARGSLGALDRPRVAVVGTRRCTHAGRATARELGHDLAAAGVCVVSGLARGIDGEAHRGALGVSGEAAPVAVVGSGLDVVYPRTNAALWDEVAAAGCLVSEYPLGTSPAPWRFPARNRIIAALADVVVVVESHAQGGSMHTVDAALERDRPVMVVPGPVRCPASAGTNDLLVAGSAAVRDARDVLAVLGLDAAAIGRRPETRPAPSPAGASVLDALGWEPATVDVITARSGHGLAEVATELARLELDGWVLRQGGWFERRAAI